MVPAPRAFSGAVSSSETAKDAAILDAHAWTRSDAIDAPTLVAAPVPTGGRPRFDRDLAGTDACTEMNKPLRCKGLSGSRSWTRTNDPLINSQLLYQLSYSGMLVA